MIHQVKNKNKINNLITSEEYEKILQKYKDEFSKKETEKKERAKETKCTYICFFVFYIGGVSGNRKKNDWFSFELNKKRK